MTQPEESPPVPEAKTSSSAAVDEAPAAVVPEVDAEPEVEPPQPWTAERVSEWNAYYDVYVFLSVLLLTFVVAAVRINSSNFWTHLKTGELIAAQVCPDRRRPVQLHDSWCADGWTSRGFFSGATRPFTSS